jgi:hypothetical protein
MGKNTAFCLFNEADFAFSLAKINFTCTKNG